LSVLLSFTSFLFLGEVKSVFPEKNDAEIKGFIRQPEVIKCGQDSEMKILLYGGKK